MPAKRSYIGRREWTVALVAVLLATGACGGSDGPTAASSPSPRSTRIIDHQQYACDTWNTARRDFLDAVRRTDITLTNPDATPTEIHNQAVEVANTLDTLWNVVLIAAAQDNQNAADWLFLLRAFEVTRGQVQHADDDPQKIQAAMHQGLIETSSTCSTCAGAATARRGPARDSTVDWVRRHRVGGGSADPRTRLSSGRRPPLVLTPRARGRASSYTNHTFPARVTRYGSPYSSVS